MAAEAPISATRPQFACVVAFGYRCAKLALMASRHRAMNRLFGWSTKNALNHAWFCSMYGNNASRKPTKSMCGKSPPDADSSFSEERCDVKIAGNTFKGDLDTYQIHVENAKGVSFDLELRKTATSWRPGTAYVDFGEDYENFFTWLCAVPQGEVMGTYTRDGKSREVHGRGYHDHQWATGQMLSFWNRWLWGRQQGDGYTILVFDSISNDASGNARFPWFFVQDAQGNIIFDNVEMGEGVSIEMDRTYVHEQTGKTLPAHSVYRFERDGVKVRYELTEERILVCNDHYAIAPEPVKAAYDAIGAAPSITRHAAIGKLTVERPGQQTIQVEGPLHYELSSQYRTFIM